MRRAYISGIISLGGTLSAIQISANLDAFYQAEPVVAALGYEPVNPVALHGSDLGPSTTEASWSYYVRKDIKHLVDCDAIYLMKNWEQSRGARLEKHIADELGMEVLYEDGTV